MTAMRTGGLASWAGAVKARASESRIAKRNGFMMADSQQGGAGIAIKRNVSVAGEKSITSPDQPARRHRLRRRFRRRLEHRGGFELRSIARGKLAVARGDVFNAIHLAVGVPVEFLHLV